MFTILIRCVRLGRWHWRRRCAVCVCAHVPLLQRKNGSDCYLMLAACIQRHLRHVIASGSTMQCLSSIHPALISHSQISCTRKDLKQDVYALTTADGERTSSMANRPLRARRSMDEPMDELEDASFSDSIPAPNAAVSGRTAAAAWCTSPPRQLPGTINIKYAYLIRMIINKFIKD